MNTVALSPSGCDGQQAGVIPPPALQPALIQRSGDRYCGFVPGPLSVPASEQVTRSPDESVTQLAGQGHAPSADRPASAYSDLRSNTSHGAALALSSDAAPFLFDPAFLSAWRESEGQPIDAEPRPEPWPYTVNREGYIVSLITGEIDPVLSAQLTLGIGEGRR